MAAAEILSTASTAASSSDIVVAAGTPLAVGLKGYAVGATVRIYLKDDAGAYNFANEINSQNPNTMITAPGTYRFTRVAGAACGVFSA